MSAPFPKGRECDKQDLSQLAAIIHCGDSTCCDDEDNYFATDVDGVCKVNLNKD